mmetsp:Transcript_22536/g.39325  ORF Transcript_22536/g.39325 Transcript_22536/m.39325 type:complete len:202 (-) Transcript_22536:251-856(-)
MRLAERCSRSRRAWRRARSAASRFCWRARAGSWCTARLHCARAAKPWYTRRTSRTAARRSVASTARSRSFCSAGRASRYTLRHAGRGGPTRGGGMASSSLSLSALSSLLLLFSCPSPFTCFAVSISEGRPRSLLGRRDGGVLDETKLGSSVRELLILTCGLLLYSSCLGGLTSSGSKSDGSTTSWLDTGRRFVMMYSQTTS